MSLSAQGQGVSLLQKYTSRMRHALLALIAVEMSRKPLPDCHHRPSSVGKWRLSLSQSKCALLKKAHYDLQKRWEQHSCHAR
jgi:hypothetical protein